MATRLFCTKSTAGLPRIVGNSVINVSLSIILTNNTTMKFEGASYEIRVGQSPFEFELTRTEYTISAVVLVMLSQFRLRGVDEDYHGGLPSSKFWSMCGT